MSLFKKINRGLILTVVVLVATATYLVTIAISHSAAQPEIKSICAKYIQTAMSYKMLPQSYRKENPAMPKAELDKYIDSMTKDLKAFYTNNEQTYKYTINDYKTSLEDQAKGNGIIYNYKKEISKYSDFVFNDDMVTVSIDSNTVFDGVQNVSTDPNLMPSIGNRQNLSSQTADTITLQNVNGKWKIIYADLVQPINDGMSKYQPMTQKVG
jgi:hypothetical protein